MKVCSNERQFQLLAYAAHRGDVERGHHSSLPCSAATEGSKTPAKPHHMGASHSCSAVTSKLCMRYMHAAAGFHC